MTRRSCDSVSRKHQRGRRHIGGRIAAFGLHLLGVRQARTAADFEP